MPRVSNVHCMRKTFGDHCKGCPYFTREPNFALTTDYICTKKDVVS